MGRDDGLEADGAAPPVAWVPARVLRTVAASYCAGMSASPDPRSASRERLRSMPSMISSQPVVAEGDIASTEDVWLLRLGGTPGVIEAHAMVGSLEGGGVAVGATLPAPTSGQLYPQWALQHGRNHFRVLLAFLTAPEVDHIDVTIVGGPPRRMQAIYRHSEPPAAFFLDDFQHVPVEKAASYDRGGELLATADLSSMDTNRVMRVVGPDNHLE